MFGRTRNYRFALALALAATALTCTTANAGGQGPGAVRKQIEASMLVTGKVEIDPQGKVTRYSLDKQDKLPSGIVDVLAQTVPAWRFEPVVVDGKQVTAIASMSIRLVANRADKDHYSVGIRSASFSGKSAKPEEDVQPVNMAPPSYPDVAVRSRVNGTAYLLIKVGRNGRVEDVATEQVNLRVVASEKDMEYWRKVLADASMSQARRWTFAPPSEGEAAGDPFWVVRVPVVYSLTGPPRKDTYGSWESYVPGPTQRNPWGDEDEGVAFGPDTLAPGASYRAGAGLKLLTNPAGG